MDASTSDGLVTALFGGGGVAGGMGMCWALLKGYLTIQGRKIETLEASVTTMKDTEIKDMKERVTTVEGRCRLHAESTTLAELAATHEAMQETVAKFDDTAKSLSREMGETRTKLDSFEGWVRDVRSEGRDLAKEVHEHAANAALHGGR